MSSNTTADRILWALQDEDPEQASGQGGLLIFKIGLETSVFSSVELQR